MKGARGLLISITGGKDLTLFEVDEAATRIREEVDGDANIILGATFDDSLEGVIRVSVVATGIDQEAIQVGNTQEGRIADLSSRLAHRPGATAAHSVAAAEMRSSFSQPAVRPAAVREAVAAPVPAPSYVPAAPTASVASAALSAIEASLELPEVQPAAEPVRAVQSAQDPRVTIEPYHPQPSAYEAPAPAMTAAPTHAATEPETVPAPYIPPVAERPAAARARMPAIEDFPPVVQNAVRAQAQPEEHHDDERRPMSLLRRLASVGLGRREDETPATQPRAQAPAPAPVARPASPAANMPSAPSRLRRAPPAGSTSRPRRPAAVAHERGRPARDPGLPAPPELRAVRRPMKGPRFAPRALSHSGASNGKTFLAGGSRRNARSRLRCRHLLD